MNSMNPQESRKSLSKYFVFSSVQFQFIEFHAGFEAQANNTIGQCIRFPQGGCKRGYNDQK